MNLIFDAGLRAMGYMLMPRVIGLSALPLLIAGALTLGLGYFFWDAAVEAVRAWLHGWWLIESALAWFDNHVGPGVRNMLAPAIVVMLTVPLIVVVSLFLVATTMTPALVSQVATRRFPALEKRHGAALWQSWLWSLVCTLAALAALLASIPLWFIPPLILIVPPLIWGWMTSKVFSYDVLADHASAAERKAILHAHRWPLLLIGIIAGYLGAAPTLVWAAGALTLVFAPLFVALSVWLYTLVFAYTALWFAHYGLAALQAHRALQPEADVVLAPVIPSSATTPALPPL